MDHGSETTKSGNVTWVMSPSVENIIGDMEDSQQYATEANEVAHLCTSEAVETPGSPPGKPAQSSSADLAVATARVVSTRASPANSTHARRLQIRKSSDMRHQFHSYRIARPAMTEPISRIHFVGIAGRRWFVTALMASSPVQWEVLHSSGQFLTHPSEVQFHPLHRLVLSLSSVFFLLSWQIYVKY